MRSHRQTGFTLIELLIVVAIIAILAAIAVPNFLEAQVRAKVSRAKTDMRTIAVAEEAYRVDWNTYSHSNGAQHNPWDPDGRGRWAGLGELTTPIAYITTIPLSPFGQVSVWGVPNQRRWPVFHLGTGNSGTKQNTEQPWNSRPEGFPADCFIIECDGPDNMKDSRDPFLISDFPWKNANPNDAPAILAIVYDPTNGTVSRGEVFRVGGQMPTGALYSALWASASK